MTETLHCYCRVSSRIQSDEGTSIETQHEVGKLKATALGMKVKFWNEGAASSDHEEIEKRPVLSSLVTAIADGTANVSVTVVPSSNDVIPFREQILLIANNDISISMIDTSGTGRDTAVQTTAVSTSTSTSSSTTSSSSGY